MKPALILLAMSLIGCEQPPPPAASVVKPTSISSELLWERSRECGSDAERAANQITREYKDSGNGSSIANWENHYNRHTERCYLSTVIMFEKWQKANEGAVPIFSVIVLDLFDHAVVASYTDERLKDGFAGAFCETGDIATREFEPAASCAAAKAHAIQLMTQ